MGNIILYPLILIITPLVIKYLSGQKKRKLIKFISISLFTILVYSILPIFPLKGEFVSITSLTFKISYLFGVMLAAYFISLLILLINNRNLYKFSFLSCIVGEACYWLSVFKIPQSSIEFFASRNPMVNYLGLLWLLIEGILPFIILLFFIYLLFDKKRVRN